jgi:hypothetical protein
VEQISLRNHLAEMAETDPRGKILRNHLAEMAETDPRGKNIIT